MYSEDYAVNSGDIIEFRAQLQRNPAIEIIDAMVELLDLAQTFNDKPQQQKQKGKGGNVKGSETRQLTKQMRTLAESLKAGGSVDLTADYLKSDYRAVVTIDNQYLNDPLMSDLVDGTFRVLGKVIRASMDPKDSVSLIRKTSLSRMPPEILENALGGIIKGVGDQGFDFPEAKWEINGPVIQVLPIAIFA